MSIQGSITQGFQAVSTACRSLRSLVTGSNTGNLSGLNVKTKTSVLAAINEIELRRHIGFKYSFALGNTARTTWVQPTSLTSIYNNAQSCWSLASGNFTFGANTVANVQGNWLFHMTGWAPSNTDFGIGIEMRVGNTAVVRSYAEASSFSFSPYINFSFPYYITGGEVISFHIFHDFAGIIGIGSSIPLSGIISGNPI